MTILVCGSYAYDSIMVFEDKFENHILPDKLHMINVSFLVPKMRKEYGGCAGNIAYNLKLLGGKAIPMATVGEDFESYFDWLDKCQIDSQAIKVIPGQFTGQAFITTDQSSNQITAFHPGAMSKSHVNKVLDVDGIKLGIVSPDGRQGMIEHAEQFVAANIPFMFDPGQGLPMFTKDELKTFISQATWLAFNDYESALIVKKTGMNLSEIASQVDAMIITKGGEGSIIYADDKEYNIPASKIESLQDPTGCGDAYRAGILFGLQKKFNWKTTGQIASLCGGINIEHLGTQNHSFTKNEFEEKYSQEFKEDIIL